MKLIIGLGNPGAEYALSRHNVGWWALDCLARLLDAPSPTAKMNGALQGPYIWRGVRLALLKPLTYMNLSGQSAGAVARFYRVEPTDCLALFDDVDLPPGRLRFRLKGSAGGHNGVKSLIAHFGTDQFPRLKIGVGAKPQGGDLAGHVLAVPKGADREVIEEAADQAARFALRWIEGEAPDKLTAEVNGYRK